MGRIHFLCIQEGFHCQATCFYGLGEWKHLDEHDAYFPLQAHRVEQGRVEGEASQGQSAFDDAQIRTDMSLFFFGGGQPRNWWFSFGFPSTTTKHGVLANKNKKQSHMT